MEDVNISKYRASVVRDGSKPASPGFVVSEGQDPVNPPGTNNYVPYSGATANVELGEYGVESGFITLDTTPTNTPVDQGTIYWDDSRSTAALIMNGTLQHIGQDTFFYVKNSSGSNIPKGTCVRFAGTDGASGHLLVTPFLANGSVPSSYFMGVTAEAIANGSFGQVMHFGELEGINTSGFTAGDLLYASSTVAGGFQTTAPVAPNNIILVAAAVNSKNNGAIVVRPTLGSNINTDEGVKITSPTTGDLLQLQAGGLWENKTIDGAGIVTKATSQVISGLKTFNVNTLMMQSSGNANAVYLSNSSGSSTYQSGFNFFGFNTDNHIYFAKSSITGGNTGILAWNNTATRTYTLKDASGTIAFTSDIPANPVGGTGTTNYLPKFTGSTTVGNSQIFDNGTNVGINQASPTRTVDILGASGIGTVLKLQGASGTTTYLQLAYNGATNAQSGYIGYNSSSQMQFFTNDTLALTIDSNRNLGLGVTPSSWNSAYRAMQFGTTGAIFGESGDAANYFTTNTFVDSVGFKYITSDWALGYFQENGVHSWRNAPSGTAGNAISFTQAMTLTSGGNLLVGTTSDNGARLQVSGTSTFSDNINTNRGNDRANILFNTTAGVFRWGMGLINTETGSNVGGDFTLFRYNDNGSFNNFALTVNRASGNVLIGTTTDNGARLQVSGTATFTKSAGVGNVASFSDNTYGLDIATTSTGGSLQTYNTNQTLDLKTYGTGTINLFTSNTERMRITSSGNVLIGTTTDSGARLQVSGAGGVNIKSGNGDQLLLNNAGERFTQINFNNNSSSKANIWWDNTNTELVLLANSVGSGHLKIASTGAATFSSSVTAKGTGNYNGFIADNSSSATIGGGYYAANSFGVQRGLFAVAGAISGTTDNNIGIFAEGGLGIKFFVNGSGTASHMMTSSGNVGIGTTSPSGKLHLSSTSDTYLVMTGGATPYTMSFLVDASALRIFQGVGDTERMRITSGGEVLIGNTDNGAYNLQCNGTGVWGAGAYVNGSDRNIKDNIATIEKGLEYIQKMNPVKFRYKPNYTRDHSMQTGFIAQELQEVFASEDYLSGLVQQGVHLSVAYQNLLPILVKAIQEQQEIINDLKQKIQ